MFIWVTTHKLCIQFIVWIDYINENVATNRACMGLIFIPCLLTGQVIGRRAATYRAHIDHRRTCFQAKHTCLNDRLNSSPSRCHIALWLISILQSKGINFTPTSNLKPKPDCLSFADTKFKTHFPDSKSIPGRPPPNHFRSLPKIQKYKIEYLEKPDKRFYPKYLLVNLPDP